ncbi:hypothetical protein WAK64_21120 [Bacillus spongiae]|uniref:Lipoprotein n=1 Tax=Bacillus spongiae TaxID=2683610 RepID=A0ABU8HJE7_9BACI
MIKSSILFSLVIGILLIAGCSDKPPMPTVSVEGESIQVVRASYCWSKGCIDTAGPPDILEGKVPYQVQMGEIITIKFENGPKPSNISVSRMLHSDQEWIIDELINDVLTIPNEEGIYYYDFHANWDSRGDSYYAFVIEVK